MDHELQAFLKDAAEREPSDLVTLSIRELLRHWGHKRRGYWVVSRIERDLEEYELETDPPFTQGWIDARVTLRPRRLRQAPAEAIDDDAPPMKRDTAASRGEITLLVGRLRSAGQGICSVTLDSTLMQAQSLMMKHDYSQLAVMSGLRNLRGAITWESIAQAGLRIDEDPQVRDCLIRAEAVSYEDDLIHHIPRIVQAGYVFVQAQDRTIGGIVTTSDLSEEFGKLATPFFLIGEIERRLRRAIDKEFSPQELSEVRDPEDELRDVGSAEDLTLGEYVRLLENPPSWERLGWRVDRKIFIETLNEIRELRNDIMHFSPDPLDDEQVDELRRFVRWLAILDP